MNPPEGLGSTQRSVHVSLRNHAYDVRIGPGLIQELGAAVADSLNTEPARAFLIHDTNLPEELVQAAAESLGDAGYDVAAAAAHAAETEKSLASAQRLLQELAPTHHERRDPVIALGGGIVGDLAGFVAATYKRGVPVIQCPTTLLSMVDASVGGKTGVNLTLTDEPESPLLKNFVGAFHQPALVLADLDALKSLPKRQFASGMAECVKHTLLAADYGDPDLLSWTESNLDAILAHDPAALTELIARNVAVKAAVVATDEHELSTGQAGRALLNLGHTFAHAIETLSDLSPTGDGADAPLHHGEAVALGLMAAAHTAATLELADAQLPARLKALLGRIGLPATIAGLPDSGQILERMGHDKKVSRGRLRLVVPTQLGHAKVVDDPDLQAVISAIDSLRS